MIRKEELYKIGKFNKPHGVHGELLFTFTDDIFDRADCDYIVCLIDGIFVPFYIKEYRFKSNTTALFTLEDISSVEKAKMFTNVEVFYPIKYIDDKQKEELSLHYFIGFTVKDLKHGVLGTICDIDESTANILFIVNATNSKQLLVPAQEELITDIDHENKTITFDLPEGLVTMNHEERD